jgi:hypothetical protein
MLHYELKNRLLRQIQVQPAPGRSVNRQVLLIASMNSSMLKPVDASGMGRQGWSVVVWPLSIDPPAAGGKVLLPPGFVETQIRQGQVWAYIRGPISGSGVSQIGLRAILPPQIRSLDQASAHITLRLRASNYAMTISRIGPDGKPGEVIKKVDNPTGIVQVDVPQLDSAGAAGGSFDFVLRLDQIRTGEDNSSQWTLESTDIALEGIAR